MTTRRYGHYRRALRSIDELEQGQVGGEAIGMLRQSAEDMLLSRERSTDVDELAEEVAVALGYLSAMGRVSSALAREILRQVCASGPGESDGSSVCESALAGAGV